MINSKSLFKYFGLFLLSYGILFGLFSTTPFATFTNNTYRSAATPILAAVFSKAYIKLEKDAPPESDIFTVRAVFTSQQKIAESKLAAKQKGRSKIDLKAQELDLYLHRMFTSFWLFLLSLIICTPISISRKAIAALAGTVLFFGYTVFKIGIILLDLFNRSDLQMYKLGAFGGNLAEGLSYVMKSLGVSAFVVVLIWILVAFRKSNWQAIIRKIG